MLIYCWHIFFFFLDVILPVSGHIRGATDGNELKGVSPSAGESLMGESQIGKVLRLLFFYMFATAIFLLYWAWGECMWGDSHCL